MAFTKEQLEQRKKGIGASEAAAVLGLNPFTSPLDIWLTKKGLKVIEDNPAMKRGRKLEPIVAEMYEDITGSILIPMPTTHYIKNPIIFATPDRIIRGQGKGLEIKTANTRMAEGWGEEGTDEIPQHYLIQCILCMAVTDLSAWDVAVLINIDDFRIYNIQRDVDLENSIIEKLLEWWETYIIGNQEPDIDSSHSCAEYLASKYPRNFKPLKEASDVEDGLLQKLAEIRYSLKSYEEQEEAVKNLLKNNIGDAEGIHGSHWKCTWKASKDIKVIDWEHVVKIILSLSGIKETLLKHGLDSKGIIEDCTIVKSGVRRFLFSPTK